MSTHRDVQEITLYPNKCVEKEELFMIQTMTFSLLITM